jgi:hypothetical protein
MGWTGRVLLISSNRGAENTESTIPMTTKTSQATISTIGIDIGTNSFHVIGFDGRGAIQWRQKLSRGQIAVRFANLPVCGFGSRLNTASLREVFEEAKALMQLVCAVSELLRS